MSLGAGMRIEPLAPPTTFVGFCRLHHIELIAKERDKINHGDNMRWYVTAEPRLEILGEGVLTSTHGNGSTPEEALADYAGQLEGCLLVIDARGDRKEIQAPNEWAPS